MELGATVCTVHQPPACAQCPIRQHCAAYTAVQAHASAGGDPADAPSVMAYPAKVLHLLCSSAIGGACMMLPCRMCHVGVCVSCCMEADLTSEGLDLAAHQVEKAKRSEQSVATCVLEAQVRSEAGSAANHLLLVQRPESGLLAGGCTASQGPFICRRPAS